SRGEVRRGRGGPAPGRPAAPRRYAWPGNVRELENVIERASVLADGPDVTPRDLPAEIRDVGLVDGVTREPARTYHAAVEEFKRGLIASTLRRTGGDPPPGGAPPRRPRPDHAPPLPDPR